MTRSDDGWRFGGLTVDRATFGLLREGAAVRIEPKALEVLIYLIERRERVVTKQELLDDLWSGTAVTENALTRAVAQIRKVLGDDLQAPRFIQTVPTRGYRFIAPLEEEPAVVPAAVALPALPAAAPLPARNRDWIFWPLFASFLFLTVLLLSAVLVATIRRPEGNRFVKFPAGKFPGSGAKGKPVPPIAARPLSPSQKLQSFPSFSPDGGTLAYSADVDGVPHIFTAPVGGGEEVQLTKGDGETQPAWSPDGKSIAYVSARRGGIWVMAAGGGTASQLTKSGSRPSWSPDGNEIAFQSAQTIEYGWTAFEALPPSAISIVDVRTGKLTALTKPGQPVGGHGAPSWRGDGKRLAFSSCDLERCAIYTIGRDGSSLTMFVDDGRRLGSPLFSTGGDTIYYVLGRYNNSVLLSAPIGENHRREGGIARRRESNPGVMQHLTMTRDGRRFAWTLVEEASDLFSIGLNDSRPKQLTASPTLRTTYPAFSPDGTKIAYCAVAAGEDSGVWVMDADGRNARAVAVGAGLKQHTGWSESGWEVIYNAWVEGPGLFKASLISGETTEIGGLPRNAAAAVLSPDGSTVAFNRTVEGEVTVWIDKRSVTSGEDLARFPVWSRRGRYLAFEKRTSSGSSIGILPAAGGPMKVLRTGEGESHPYSFSPDETQVVFAGSRGGIWNLYAIALGGGPERQLTRNESLTRWLRSPVWSPTGDRIVYESGAPKANIWVSQQ